MTCGQITRLPLQPRLFERIKFDLGKLPCLNWKNTLFKFQQSLGEKKLETSISKIFICQSENMRKILDIIKQVAHSNATVLITGESGTGKELVARSLHLLAFHRRSSAFVPVNCGAIPKELLESELFGHVKGAFTGAYENRKGRFEQAQGGTIFFDEIGDMSLQLQVKLLRVLQEKQFEPVGSNKTITSDTRVIAATNINLEEAVNKGLFRKDLFYRLNVIPINIPPLRERKEDITILFYHFLKKFNSSLSKNIYDITSEAMNLFIKYPWPGNIRELENCVERLVIFKNSGTIHYHDLPDQYKQNYTSQTSQLDSISQGVDFNSVVEAYENELILKALEKTGWNRSQAALLLNLNRTTLLEKMKKKGLKQTKYEKILPPSIKKDEDYNI